MSYVTQSLSSSNLVLIYPITISFVQSEPATSSVEKGHLLRDFYFPPKRLNNPPVMLPSPLEPPPGVCGAAANTRLAKRLNGKD